MKKSAIAKSSFTLPPEEVALVSRLKRSLHLPTNTAVVRMALFALQKKVDREALRQQFQSASQQVQKHNRAEMTALDQLADEGLSED